MTTRHMGQVARRLILPVLIAAALMAGSGPAIAQTRTGPLPAAANPAPINVPPPTPPPPYLPFPQFPAVTLDEANNGVGLAQQAARAGKLQARILWIDATANLNRINSADKIAALVERIKSTGFNTIVLDVKPIVGFTLYPSQLAPRLTEWGADGRLSAEFDPVMEFVNRAHAAGLQIVASMNTFSEGHQRVHKGLGYDHPEWQTVLYEPRMQVRGPAPGAAPFPLTDRPNQRARSADELAIYSEIGPAMAGPDTLIALVASDGRVLALVDGAAASVLTRALPPGAGALVGSGAGAAFLQQNARVGDRLILETTPTYVPISQRPERQVPLMVNPNSAAVRQRILDIIAELVRGYALDGVIFDDRLRYADINADFSEESRAQFEAYVGKAVIWPDDVFRYEVKFPTLHRHVVPGPLYEAWLVWRAMNLRNWLDAAAKNVKAIRPQATVSVYVGSCYGEYPLLGSNWAADDFVAGFRFLTPSYQQTGFAGLLDWMTAGCYYPDASIDEAVDAGPIPGASVEAAGQLANRAANDQSWCYAGIALDSYTNRPEALKNALQAACASTQGVMVFDLSHFSIRNNDSLWSVFAEAFKEPAAAPHTVDGLLARVRRDHSDRKARGIADPPVIIHEGIPGTGL